MTTDVLRGGMVGAGAWSRTQLTAWQGVKGTEIVALCDHNQERRHAVVSEFNIAAQFDSLADMLNHTDMDFVDICTQPHSHAELARLAADHGCDILCQKPYCQTLSEAQHLNHYVRQAGVRLMVNENFRWQGWYRQIKTILNEGHIGTPFMANLHVRQQVTMPTFQHAQAYFQDMPKLILYEMGVHYLDTMRYLFGQPQTVYARLHKVNPAIAGEDAMMLILDYTDMTVNICGSWGSLPVPDLDYVETDKGKPASPPRFQIDGTTGTLVLDASGKLSLHTHSGQTDVWHFDHHTRPMSRIAAQQHFVDSLHSGQKFETDGEETVYTMALVYGGYQSASTAQAIDPNTLLTKTD